MVVMTLSKGKFAMVRWSGLWCPVHRDHRHTSCVFLSPCRFELCMGKFRGAISDQATSTLCFYIKNTENFQRQFLTFWIGFMSVLVPRARCLPQGTDFLTRQYHREIVL